MRDLTPRRADTTAVIGSALLASARGTRDPAHVEWLRARAVNWPAGSTVTSNVITRWAAGATVVGTGPHGRSVAVG